MAFILIPRALGDNRFDTSANKPTKDRIDLKFHLGRPIDKNTTGSSLMIGILPSIVKLVDLGSQPKPTSASEAPQAGTTASQAGEREKETMGKRLAA